MVSKYARDCSGCNYVSKTRKRWLSHLLQPGHQKQARKGCSSWQSKVKKRIIIFLANFPIATNKKLYSFTDVVGRDKTIVDFIWSEGQPRIGLFKFENKATVNEIMKRFGGQKLRLDDDHVLQLNKATDFSDIEWHVLLDEIKGFDSDSESDSDDDDESDDSVNGGGDNLHPIENEEEYVIFEEPPWSPARSPNLYRQQFNDIVNEIGILDEDYQQALGLMEKCERIFAKQFPACKLYMFRHWYLKLWNNGTNELLFYVDFDGALDGSHAHKKLYDREEPFSLQQEQVEKLFTSKAGRKILPGVEAVEKRQADHEPRAFQFHQKPSDLKFSIAGDSHFRTEAQTCRLVDFLLDCDPRARPLLTLIFYWAKQCEVVTSQPVFKRPRLSHAKAPQPASLEWMILQFLVNKKIIPSPREVQKRVHKKLVVFSETDIGFSNEEWNHPSSSGMSNIPPENSNEFFIHLVELARDFFNFYLKLRSGSWILNTRDGEAISMEDFLSLFDNHKASHQVEQKTKLRSEEIAKIMITERRWEKRTFVMLHPLVCQWQILFSAKACRFEGGFKMACAAAVINLALERDEEEGNNQEFNLATVFQPPTTKMLIDIVQKLPFAHEDVIFRIEEEVGKIEPPGKRVNQILRKLKWQGSKTGGGRSHVRTPETPNDEKYS
ncbi:unnamed protein product [Orchesella dallaii]|uniref:Uncharacterized protein n=1 Tax=Orchesella dallaii TaxID=48710 RepID=A0ABP1PZV5_9HEXA